LVGEQLIWSLVARLGWATLIGPVGTVMVKLDDQEQVDLKQNGRPHGEKMP